MEFEGIEFARLKEGKTGIVGFEHLEDHDNPVEWQARMDLRQDAKRAGLFIFQITDEYKKIRIYACRTAGSADEIESLHTEVKGRISRVYASIWNTIGFISFLSNKFNKNKFFDVKGGDKDNTIKVDPREVATAKPQITAKAAATFCYYMARFCTTEKAKYR